VARGRPPLFSKSLERALARAFEPFSVTAVA